MAAPQQEAEPVEVDARDRRGHLLARPLPEARRSARRRARRPRSPSATQKVDVHVRARPVHRQEEPDRRARATKVDPKTTSTVVVEKETQGLRVRLGDLALLDREAAGRRSAATSSRSRANTSSGENTGSEFVLRPLAEGAVLEAGRRDRGADLACARKHEAEYVHLRDPRGGGPRARERRFALQVGPRHRLVRGDARQRRRTSSSSSCRWASTRSSTACARTWPAPSASGPATVQSMYAPEFTAYSAGAVLKVAGGSPP